MELVNGTNNNLEESFRDAVEYLIETMEEDGGLFDELVTLGYNKGYVDAHKQMREYMDDTIGELEEDEECTCGCDYDE